MKGKAGAQKKAGLPGANKAGNVIAAGKKAGAAPKKAGTAPRDFVLAKIAMDDLIGEYSDIYPLQRTYPNLRRLIISSIQNNDIADLQSLAKAHGSKFTAEIRQSNVQVPILVAAAEARNLPALEFLLSLGVDPEQTSTTGETALHAAVRAEFEAGLVLLHSYGASDWIADSVGNTPFVIAAVKGAEAILMRLVDFGVNPWKRDSTDRWEIEYIADERVRKRVAARAYWLKKRGFAWVMERPRFSRVNFNLKELISSYL